MKVETIYGKSLYQMNIEADQRQELTSWQRKYKKRYVEKVEIENLAKTKAGQYYQWKLIITYSEQS